MKSARLFISQLCIELFDNAPDLLVDTAYVDAQRIIKEAKGWFVHVLNAPESAARFPGTDQPFLLKGREGEKGWEIVIQAAQYQIAKREDGSVVYGMQKDSRGQAIPLQYPDTVKDEKNDAFFEVKTEAQAPSSAARN